MISKARSEEIAVAQTEDLEEKRLFSFSLVVRIAD